MNGGSNGSDRMGRLEWLDAPAGFKQQVGQGRWTQLGLRVFALGALLVLLGSAPSAMAQQAGQAPGAGVSVSPIEAVFDPPAQTTVYSILLADQQGNLLDLSKLEWEGPVMTEQGDLSKSQHPQAGLLSIRWSGPDCGQWGAVEGEPTTLRWFHPHPPCDPTTDHRHVTVAVDVSVGAGLAFDDFRCEYQGSHSGVGPACVAEWVDLTSIDPIDPPQPVPPDGPAIAAPAPPPVVEEPPPAVVEEQPAPPPSDPQEPEPTGPGIPWWVWVPVVVVGAGAGLWTLTRRPPAVPPVAPGTADVVDEQPTLSCDELLRRWTAAQRECDEARREAELRGEQAERARDAAWEALKARSQVERELEATPPQPSASDLRKQALDQAHAEWQQQRAQASSDAGRAQASAEFQQRTNQIMDMSPDELVRQDAEARQREAQARLDAAREAEREANEAAEAAEAAAREAAQRADEACARADAARRAYEECIGQRGPGGTTAVGGGDGASPGGGGPGGPPGGPAVADRPGDSTRTRERGCPEGAEQERNHRELSLDVPVELRPLIQGGHAQAAAEQGAELAGVLQQGAVVTQALGRILAFAPGAKLVHNFSAGGAARLGAATASEATGVPIPTSPAEAAANVVTLYLTAGSTIIRKVTELQARRLPDVDMTIQMMVAPYLLTCCEVWVCQNGEWVYQGKRLTIERTGPARSGGQRRVTRVTWAEAQEALAVFARTTFQPRLTRALEQMAQFQNQCGG